MAWVDGVRRAQAEAFRQGGNHPIQGGAQEVVKWAMVRWDRKYRGLVNTHIPCKLLMQIHDELLFEIAVPKHDPDRVRWAADMLIRMMTEDSPKYRVPILAEAKIGRSWAEQKKLDLKGPWHG
jgi:DNA polymerase-1